MSHRVIQPENWARPKGYANGVLTDDGTLYVGGLVGWTVEQKFESHDFIGQMEQALSNILDVVTAAGGKAENITRLTWYMIDRKSIWPDSAKSAQFIARYWGVTFPP